MAKKVLIVGGGFGGIRVALGLAGRRNLEVTLVSDRDHFEYYPVLYRVVLGGTTTQASIPFQEIFAGKKINIVQDSIASIDLQTKKATGAKGQEYEYDYLVIGVGSETGYFGLPGLPELSFGFKSIEEASALRAHIHQVLTPTGEEMTPDQKTIAAHFVVVGGGPTGIELASELTEYAHKVAKKHGFDPSAITVDLIEALPRLLPILPEDVSAAMKQQLYTEQVNVYLNRMVTGQEGDTLTLKDMSLRSQTVIWTAGMKPNRLLAQVQGAELEKRGKMVIDEFLQAKNYLGVFVLGDNAPTQYAGMAQTADYDGKYVSDAILRLESDRKLVAYVPKKPIYAIPAGQEWGMVLWGNSRMYGKMGVWLRNLADIRYFMSILPFGKAWQLYGKRNVKEEVCAVCSAKKK